MELVMIHHYENYNILGDFYKKTEPYEVIDNLKLDKLVLSQIVLHSGQETRGHFHYGVEEVYFFQFGQGKILIGIETVDVQAGSIVLVPDGHLHRVYNTGATDLVFHTVYNRLEESNTVYAK
jgi:mannose-6-phosphate isomerase-like protein (cupin superfamily)